MRFSIQHITIVKLFFLMCVYYCYYTLYTCSGARICIVIVCNCNCNCNYIYIYIYSKYGSEIINTYLVSYGFSREHKTFSLTLKTSSIDHKVSGFTMTDTKAEPFKTVCMTF